MSDIVTSTHFGCANCEDFYLIVGPLRTVVKVTEGGQDLGLDLLVEAAEFFRYPECSGCFAPLTFGRDPLTHGHS
ncbi:hypothetical protein ABZ348_31050 [Streptomyces sp. NPDC005963]|uniref:hypothetical protein n=1 Tax=Streptomyces sp. NPDC005963 TaxID=3156721 RepID=UPI0033E87877